MFLRLTYAMAVELTHECQLNLNQQKTKLKTSDFVLLLRRSLVILILCAVQKKAMKDEECKIVLVDATESEVRLRKYHRGIKHSAAEFESNKTICCSFSRSRYYHKKIIR